MTAKELREKFDNDLLRLQNTCPHKKRTLMEHHFAPGHSTGHLVLVCNHCEKLLEKHEPIRA